MLFHKHNSFLDDMAVKRLQRIEKDSMDWHKKYEKGSLMESKMKQRKSQSLFVMGLQHVKLLCR